MISMHLQFVSIPLTVTPIQGYVSCTVSNVYGYVISLACAIQLEHRLGIGNVEKNMFSLKCFISIGFLMFLRDC